MLFSLFCGRTNIYHVMWDPNNFGAREAERSLDIRPLLQKVRLSEMFLGLMNIDLNVKVSDWRKVIIQEVLIQVRYACGRQILIF